MYIFRFFLLLFIIDLPFYSISQDRNKISFKYIKSKELIVNADFFSTDNLGQLYLIKGDQLFKYDKNGSLLFTYSNKVLGQITYLDASNPLRLLLYYRDFGQIEFLDDALSLIGSQINLEEKMMGQSTLACTSTNDEMWIYNPLDFRLIRVNQNMQISYESININQLSGLNILPNFMIEYNNWLYLNDPNFGVLVFDLFGTYSKTIPIKGLSSFKIENQQLVYFKEGKLISYDLISFSENEFSLPKMASGAKDIRVEKGEKLLAVFKENNVELFLIED